MNPIKYPAPLKRGPKWLRTFLNGLLVATRKGAALAGIGTFAFIGPDGTSISVVGIDQPEQNAREFDISVLSHTDSTLKVLDGTWMGISQAGAINPGTRDAYHTLTVANGDKVYLKLEYNHFTSVGTLTLMAGAATPANDPDAELFYTELGTVSIAAELVSFTQTRWGPLEYAGPVEIDVLVGLRIQSGQLQGQYKTVMVDAAKAANPEWENLIEVLPNKTKDCNE